MAGNAVRLAVLGDTHFTADRFWPAPAANAGAAHDRAKYLANVAQHLPRLLGAVAAAGPDFVLHSGDLAEGAPGDAELAWALDQLRRGVDAPVLLARGNHDRAASFSAAVTPHNATVAGVPATGVVWRCDLGPVGLVVVDSTSFTAAHAPELAAALAAPATWHVVLAHSPAINCARPFFRDRPFAAALLQVAARQRVDLLLCGHTHNSALVSYDTGGHPLSQLKLCSVQWVDQPVPLAAAKTWLVPAARQRAAWTGYLENSPPVFGLLDATADHLAVTVRSLAGHDVWRGELTADGRVTVLADATPPLPSGSVVGRVREAWLCCSVLGGTQGVTEVLLGDVPLGRWPTALPWYHHRTPIDPALLGRLGDLNEVRLRAVEAGPVAVGSLTIEVLLADGTRRFARPAPGILVTGDLYRGWPEPEVVRAATVEAWPPCLLAFD